jgi:hypothetical protein
MKAKPTKAEVQMRTEEILRIRLDGAEMWDVREYVREKERELGSLWELPPAEKPMSDSQLWRYIARADTLIAESCRASRKKLFRRHLAQRRNLYAKAVSAGDYRTALAIARDEGELLALYPSKKVQFSGSKDEPLTVNVEAMTDEDRAAAVQRIVARFGLPPSGAAGAPADRDGAGDGHGPLLG